MFDYNEDQQLLTETRPERTISFTYNSIGDLTSKSDDTGSVLYSYDAFGRLAQRTDINDRSIGYAYNEEDLLQTLTYSDGKQVTYQYDENLRLVEVTDWESRSTRYGYTDANRLSSMTKPDGSAVSFNYDNAQQLLRKAIDANNSQPIANWRYTLNGIGKRIATEAFEPLPPQPSIEAEFDYNALSQQSVANGIEQLFDADGNMTNGVLGNIQSEFVYNSINQLVSVAANDQTFNVKYDVDGNRIASGYSGEEHQYVVDGTSETNRVLEEWQGDRLVARYVWGLGLISSEIGSAHSFRVYHFDTRGSTIALTDPQGNLTDAYSYDSYGELKLAVGQSHNPFRYNGRDGVMLEDNGLYFMQMRYFNPNTQRFIGKDILLGSMVQSQSLNRYSYVTGDPISLIDPLGLSGQKDTSEESFDKNIIGEETTIVECKKFDNALCKIDEFGEEAFWMYTGYAAPILPSDVALIGYLRKAAVSLVDVEGPSSGFKKVYKGRVAQIRIAGNFFTVRLDFHPTSGKDNRVNNKAEGFEKGRLHINIGFFLGKGDHGLLCLDPRGCK